MHIQYDPKKVYPFLNVITFEWIKVFLICLLGHDMEIFEKQGACNISNQCKCLEDTHHGKS